MPIYEYLCKNCGKKSEFITFSAAEQVNPQCPSCGNKNMTRLLSRVRVIMSEETRLEALADPSKFGDLDENDPKSMGRFMKKMGREFGDELGEDVDQIIEETMEEEEKRRKGKQAPGAEPNLDTGLE